ncbi:MAG: VTT domain-containing protein [Chthoniobacter sp.]|nr:VTT domain-containing protein [Chthoniobacter sp.]
MREFLNHYGLWAAFLLALLENDVSFIAIGVVARLGDGDPSTPDEFNLYTALVAAIVGALIHDTFWFVIGHQHSDWFKSSKVYLRIGPAIERLAKRFGPWEIFFARFVYGTRNPTSIFWGIHHLPYATFAGIELLALTLWGSLLVTIGFHFTSLALKIIGRVERHHHPQLLLITLVLSLIGIYLLRWYNRRRIYKRQLARAALAEKSEDAAPEDAASR